MQNLSHTHRLWLILLLGLVLRWGYALPQPTDGLYTTGGDVGWYLVNGAALFSGEVTGEINEIEYDISVIPIAPLYLIFVGVAQWLLPDTAAIIAIRLIQGLLGTATLYFAYRITNRLTSNQNAGLLAALVLAISPAFVMESALILTETLFMFWLVGGLWLYVDHGMVITHEGVSFRWRYVLLAGLLLGFATLTRAVLLLFPVGIAGHILFVSGWKNWRRVLPLAGAFLLVYGGAVSTWTIYNWVQWDRFVIGSDQLMPVIWRGAVTYDSNPWVNDELLGDSTHTEEVVEVVSSDPLGYIQLRLSELTIANLQPHGTIDLQGESLRVLVSDWLREDRSVGGLFRVINADGFWLKLTIYALHYIGLIGGLIGLWLTRHRWRVSLVPVGYIVYTLLLHLVMLAIPRYIFPTQIFLWCFASIALIHLWERISQRQINTEQVTQPGQESLA